MSLFKSDDFTESSLHQYNDDTDPTVQFSATMPPEEDLSVIIQPAPLFSAPTPEAELISKPMPEPIMAAIMPEPIVAAKQNAEPMAPQQTAAAATEAYGIEKIIRLMHASPAENSELVISIIIKTLESAGINTQALLSDAAAKENQAQFAMQKLEKEIQFLESQVGERRQQIASLSTLLENFTLIKSKIEQVM